MRNVSPGFAILVLLAIAIKGAAMLEMAPLYHTLLLVPAKAAALLSGESYTESQGVYRFSSFVLDYSCAGANFLLLCVITGAWHFRHRMQTAARLAGTGVLIAAGAWLTANIANTFRIGLSLKLFHHHAQHAWLHEAIGTIVFITFLMGYYQLILRFNYAKADAAG